MMILDERGAEIHHSEPRLGVNSMKDGQRTRLRNWQAQKRIDPLVRADPFRRCGQLRRQANAFADCCTVPTSRNNLKPSATSNAPKTIA